MLQWDHNQGQKEATAHLLFFGLMRVSVPIGRGQQHGTCNEDSVSDAGYKE
jgi:hypothetical protein